MTTSCHGCSTFAGPLQAMKAPREKLVYVVCTYGKQKDKGDYLATVDIDPQSSDYCRVIHRLHVPNVGDELHHMGWNACVSCPSLKRKYLLIMALHGDRIYAVDAVSDPRQPSLAKIIDSEELYKYDLSFPHTSHCVSTGEVLISTIGDRNGNAKGDFLILDSQTLEVKNVQSKQYGTKPLPFGYDFWYQPRHNVIVSSEWGAPKLIKNGFNPQEADQYGQKLHILNWKTRQEEQELDLGPEGKMALEVRFLHNPDSSIGFVASALGSTLFRYYKRDDGTWGVDKVAQVAPKRVENWCLPAMPAIISDYVISLDDRFLYMSCWLHGDIRQYDISDSANPKLVGQVFVGGAICNDRSVKVLDEQQPEPAVVKGRRVEGGPQMVQLSLDGRRLYVTTSLYSVWDAQFYPEMVQKGSVMLQIDADTEKGGLKINPDFLVDFGAEPDGPAQAHESRFPGGDCTSDIWV